MEFREQLPDLGIAGLIKDPVELSRRVELPRVVEADEVVLVPGELGQGLVGRDRGTLVWLVYFMALVSGTVGAVMVTLAMA